ncbi:MAG: hypothetical protein ACO1TE_23020 [Prosthecobacter sp.]
MRSLPHKTEPSENQTTTHIMSTTLVFTNNIVVPIPRNRAKEEKKHPSASFSIVHVRNGTAHPGVGEVWSGADHYLVAKKGVGRQEMEPVTCPITSREGQEYPLRVSASVGGCESGKENDLVQKLHGQGPFEKQIELLLRVWVEEEASRVRNQGNKEDCPVEDLMRDPQRWEKVLSDRFATDLWLAAKVSFGNRDDLRRRLEDLRTRMLAIECSATLSSTGAIQNYTVAFSVDAVKEGGVYAQAFVRWMVLHTNDELCRKLEAHAKTCYESFLVRLNEDLLTTRAPEVLGGLQAYFDPITNISTRFGLEGKVFAVTPANAADSDGPQQVAHMNTLIDELRKQQIELVKAGDTESLTQADKITTRINKLEEARKEARKGVRTSAHARPSRELVTDFTRVIAELNQSPLRLGNGATYTFAAPLSLPSGD